MFLEINYNTKIILSTYGLSSRAVNVLTFVKSVFQHLLYQIVIFLVSERKKSVKNFVQRNTS